jgi:hypothetical protein
MTCEASLTRSIGARRGWEHRKEADEAVAVNLDACELDAWDRLKSTFRGTPEERLEAFRQVLHDDSRLALECQEAKAEAAVRRLIRQRKIAPPDEWCEDWGEPEPSPVPWDETAPESARLAEPRAPPKRPKVDLPGRLGELTATIEKLERDLDALATELAAALDELPKKARERYERGRERRNGPTP